LTTCHTFNRQVLLKDCRCDPKVDDKHPEESAKTGVWCGRKERLELIIFRHMKIYTRSGDKGTTSLIGGKRVTKSNRRIEAYGTVDELIAHIGLLRDQVSSSTVQQILINIQDKLMICAAILASDCEDCKVRIPELKTASLQELEDAIDNMEKELPELTSFVLPGGHAVSSFAHVARTVCRRAERRIVELSAKHFVPDIVLQYVNRLSDFLFVLSRKLLVDNQGDELKWIAGL